MSATIDQTTERSRTNEFSRCTNEKQSEAKIIELQPLSRARYTVRRRAGASAISDMKYKVPDDGETMKCLKQGSHVYAQEPV